MGPIYSLVLVNAGKLPSSVATPQSVSRWHLYDSASDRKSNLGRWRV